MGDENECQCLYVYWLLNTKVAVLLDEYVISF